MILKQTDIHSRFGLYGRPTVYAWQRIKLGECEMVPW